MSQLFKILQNGKSWHGGNLSWSLPTQAPDGAWQPGAWHEVALPIECCSRGLHLTDNPAAWWGNDAMAFVVECDGATDGPRGDKIAAQRVRLMRPATAAELERFGIFVQGEHTVDKDVAFASGSAQVTAYDSAQVTAYDSAQVRAHDSSQVTAHGSAQVTAYDSAQVRAHDSAQVTAYGSAQVTAYGSAQVTAEHYSTVTQYRNTTKVKLRDQAVRIDRSGDRVRCFRAKRRTHAARKDRQNDE